jgi:hypothetical protein
MKVFEIYNDDLEDIEVCLKDEDEVYDFFDERLGPVDAATLMEWAMHAEVGNYWDMMPCVPYIIRCKEK